MKITKKDLREWAENKTNIRYRETIYKLIHNGQMYLLCPVGEGEQIPIYHISRGVYGLETNRKNV